MHSGALVNLQVCEQLNNYIYVICAFAYESYLSLCIKGVVCFVFLFKSMHGFVSGHGDFTVLYFSVRVLQGFLKFYFGYPFRVFVPEFMMRF